VEVKAVNSKTGGSHSHVPHVYRFQGAEKGHRPSARAGSKSPKNSHISKNRAKESRKKARKK